MTRALFSISQDVLSSEKQRRKRQLFVDVVDSRSELESVAKLSFTVVFFSSFFPLLSKGSFSAHLSKPFRLQAWVSDWIHGSHDSLGSAHLLSVGGLFLMSDLLGICLESFTSRLKFTHFIRSPSAGVGNVLKRPVHLLIFITRPPWRFVWSLQPLLKKSLNK